MWQNWTNIVIGLWLAGAPWILGTAPQESRGMIYNCVLSGLLIASFALWAALSKAERWQELAVVLFCIWLFIAPGTLQYTVPLITWNNVLVGLTVGTLALWCLERRQPRAF
jgi:SPW repeat